MFRFKQFLLILENRIDFLKGRQSPEFHDVIDHYATNADPTEGKEYTSKLLSWHKAGLIKPEDHPYLKDLLTDFHQQKQKLQKRDINQYKTPSQLEDAVSEYAGSLSGKKEDERIKKEEVEHIHNENGVTISSPRTENAACLLGKSTKWCTTWTGTHPSGEPKNMFKHYNDEGPLYVINTPSGKYQYHPAGNEFRNAEDEEVDLNTVALKHPEIATGLRKIGLGKDLAMNREELEKRLNNKSGDRADLLEKHPLVTPEDITKTLDDPNTPFYIKNAAIRHPTAVTKEHIEKLLHTSPYQNTPEEEELLKHGLQYSPAVTTDHVDTVMKSDDNDRKIAVLSNQNKGIVQNYHIDMALEPHFDPDEQRENSDVRQAAMSSPAVEPYHINNVLNDNEESHRVKRDALFNKAVTSKQVKKILNGNDTHLKEAVIVHPTAVGPEDIDKYLSGKSTNYIKTILLKNSSGIRPHHIDKIVNDYIENGVGLSSATTALRHKLVTPENIDNLLSEKNKKIASMDDNSKFGYEKLKRFAFEHSPAIEPHHIDNLLDDHDNLHENTSVIEAALAHPTAVQSHHIDKILDNPELKDNHLMRALQHPTAVTSEHIGRALRDPNIYDYNKKDILTHPKVLPSHIDYILNDPDIPEDVKKKALEHPTAVRSRHIDELLSEPNGRSELQGIAVFHPTAMKPRHIDKLLSSPDYSPNVIRSAFNPYSEANAILPRHIEKVLSNPDNYDDYTYNRAVNHPVTREMAANKMTVTT